MTSSISRTVSPALINVPIVDAASGMPTPQFFQAWQSLVSGAQPASWDPVLTGSSGGSGATYSAQWGAVCRIGQFELCLFSLTLSSLGSGLAGNAEIATLPSLSGAGGSVAGWLGEWGGVTLSGGCTMLGLSVASGAAAATLMQSGSGLTAQPLPVSALGASAHLAGAVFYPV